MKAMRSIIGIRVESIGWIHRYSQVKRFNKLPHETTWIDVDDPIESFMTETGDIWYRQDNSEFNGKYVIEVKYQTIIPTTSTP